MDWQALQAKMPADRDLPARAARILALNSVLDGTLYNVLRTPFSEELTGGQYVPLAHRRPSVRSGICRSVVDDSVSLLFSEGHFPRVHANDATTVQAIAAWVKERRLNELLADAATRGSVGSVALLFRVLKGRPFVTVMPTQFLTPTWDAEDPDRLVLVKERYKVRGADLLAQGYSIPEDATGESFWFQRSWDDSNETWFLPLSVTDARDGKMPVVDDQRSITHGLGFLPVIWIRNLSGGDDVDVDGGCTFEAAIDTVIEVDYQLSQAGRGLKYAADPRLVIRDPGADENKPLTGGASGAIVLSDPTAEARFLEINGTAASAVLEHVRYLRSVALESIHGNRADPDKLSAAQSGRAMELLCQPLVWLADRLRTSYGEGGLVSLLRMFCAASGRVNGGLVVAGTRYSNLSSDGLALIWQPWFAPTAADKVSQATTLQTLTEAGLLSRDAARRQLADVYDVEDAAAEAAAISADEAAAAARAAALPAVQTKLSAEVEA